MEEIIFISCGAKKCEYTCQAQEMYKGCLFKELLRYAKIRAMVTNAEIYILSAKYGILDLTTIIEPYNKTINKQNVAQYSKLVISQCKKRNLYHTKKHVVFACGTKYYKPIESCFTNTEDPFMEVRSCHGALGKIRKAAREGAIFYAKQFRDKTNTVEQIKALS